MKIEEAIRILGKQKLLSPLGQASFVAIVALKKQIPKKVVRKTRKLDLSSADECPCCGFVVSREFIYYYCPKCGQKLDWRKDR